MGGINAQNAARLSSASMHLQHKVFTVAQGPHRNLLLCFGVLASSRSVRIGPWLRVSPTPCSDDQISNLVAVRD